MNTQSNHYDDTDERPEAVRQAAAGAQAWRATVHAQGSAPLDHSDFYSIAGELTDTLAAVAALAEVLAWQVGRYGDENAVYDDSRVVDPRERLNAAAADLHEVAARVREADRVVNTFWSRISHIGVESAPDEPAEVGAEVAAAVAR